MDVNEMITVATKELTAAFKKFDVDHSGFLEKNEFGQLIRRIAMAFNVEEPSFTDIDNLVAAIDTNGDGRITQLEF
jgi:Ca2+-binding EF-hand superfamily protein